MSTILIYIYILTKQYKLLFFLVYILFFILRTTQFWIVARAFCCNGKNPLDWVLGQWFLGLRGIKGVFELEFKILILN